MNFNTYTLEQYKKDIDEKGLKEVWMNILEHCKNTNAVPELLKTENFGELYEIGLAAENKTEKKESGKYYTPEDVAELLVSFFNDLEAKNVCDVCCGTGNLILSYLKSMEYEDARKALKEGTVFLYDIDETAMNICKTCIGMEYGKDVIEHINCIEGDFLSQEIKLPENSRVISNPPYYKITEISKKWERTDVIKDSKELYSAFIEKIVKNSEASVIITPFSFIGSDKFYSLRKVLNNHNGMIFSFDNVPANIFNGKKHGIFNSNSSNAVRVAITITEDKSDKKGFRISPLIRFQAEERKRLLNKDALMKLLPDEYQIVTNKSKKYHKCFSQVNDIYNSWVNNSDGLFGDLLTKEQTNYSLCVPTTCRYYLSATEKDLDRNGKNTLYFRTEKDKEYAYCLLNSSFAYWHWRLFDGGITYPTGLLKTIPIKTKIGEEGRKEINKMVSIMRENESNYFVYKMNASKIQENVKFPVEFRDRLNEIILATLGIKTDIRCFDCIHSNSIFGKECG